MKRSMEMIKIMVLCCDVKKTVKIGNDPLFSQCPILVSKCKITDKN